MKKIIFLILLGLASLATAQDNNLDSLYFRPVTIDGQEMAFPYPDVQIMENLRNFLAGNFNRDVYQDYIRLQAIRSGTEAVRSDLQRLLEKSGYDEKALRFAIDLMLSYRQIPEVITYYHLLFRKHPACLPEYETMINVLKNHSWPTAELQKEIAAFYEMAGNDFALKLRATEMFYANSSPGQGWQHLEKMATAYPERLGEIFRLSKETLQKFCAADEILGFWLPRLDPFRHTQALADVFTYMQNEHRLDGYLEKTAGRPDRKAILLIHAHISGQSDRIDDLLEGLQGEKDKKSWALMLNALNQPRRSLALYLRALNDRPEAEVIAAIIDLLARGEYLRQRHDVSNLKIIFSFDANISFLNGLISLVANSNPLAPAVNSLESQYHLLLNYSYIDRLLALLQAKFPAYPGLNDLKLKLASRYHSQHQYKIALQLLEALPGDRPEVLKMKLQCYESLKMYGPQETLLRKLLAVDRGDYLHWLSRTADFLKSRGGFLPLLALFKEQITAHPADKEIYLKYISYLEDSQELGELEQAYRLTARQFADASLFHRLARFFLQRKKWLQFQELCLQLADTLEKEELNDFSSAFLIGSDMNFKNMESEFLLGVYRRSLKRFPTDTRLAGRLLQLLEKDPLKHDAELKKLYLKYFLLDEGIRQKMFAYFNRIGYSQVLADDAAGGDEFFKNCYLSFYHFDRTDYRRSLDNLDVIKEGCFANEGVWKTLARLSASFSGTAPGFLSGLAAAFSQLRQIAPLNSAYYEEPGNYLAYAGDYAAAEKLWERLLEMEPGSVSGYSKLAFLHKSFFQIDKALAVVERGEKTLGPQQDLLLLKALFLEDKKEWRRSLLAFFDCVTALEPYAESEYNIRNHLLKLAKNHGPLFENTLAEYDRQNRPERLALFMFRFYADEGRLDRARQFLLNALSAITDINALEAIQQEMENRESEGEVSQAVMKRLLEIDPLFLNYYSRLAGLYENQGQKQQAEAVYKEALTRFHGTYKFAAIFREYLDFLWRSRQFASGFAVIKQRLDQMDEKQRLLLLNELADKYLEIEAYTEAREVLGRLIKMRPADEAVQLKYLRALESGQDEAELLKAVQFFADGIRAGLESSAVKNSKLFALYRKTARILLGMGKNEKGIDYLIEAVNRDPLNVENLKWSFFTARALKLNDRFRDYYLRLADKSTSDFRWPVVLARLHRWQGDDEKALETMRKALQIEPHQEFLYEEIFRITAGLKRHDQALDILKKQLAITDNKRDVLLALAEELSLLGRDQELGEIIARLIRVSPYDSTYAAVLDLLLKQKKTLQALTLANQFYDGMLNKIGRDYLDTELLSGVARTFFANHQVLNVFEKFKSLRQQIKTLKESKGGDVAATNFDRVVDFLKFRWSENMLREANTADIGVFREAVKNDLLALSNLEFAEDMLKGLNFNLEVTLIKTYYLNYYLNDLPRSAGQVSDYVDFFKKWHLARGNFEFFRDYMVNYEHFKLRAPREFYQTAILALKLSGNRELYFEYLKHYVNAFVLTRKVSAENSAFAAEDAYLADLLAYLAENKLNTEIQELCQKPFYFRGQLLNELLRRDLFEPARQAVRLAFSDKPAVWRQSKPFLIGLYQKQPDESLRQEILNDRSVSELLRSPAAGLEEADRLKLAFVYYRFSRDGRFMYSLAEKSPLTASAYEKTADQLRESGEPEKAENYYRNALALEKSNTVLAKLARLQFAGGRKTEAEQTVNSMALVTYADCKMYLELWQDWGALDRAWPPLKKYLLQEENQKRGDYFALLQLTYEADRATAMETLSGIAAASDAILDHLLAEDWINEKESLYALAENRLGRFGLKRRQEILSDMCSHYLAKNQLFKAEALLNQALALEKTADENLWRLKLALILKKNSAPELQTFVAEIIDKFSEGNFSESLVDLFKAHGRESDYFGLQMKIYANRVAADATNKDLNYKQWIYFLLKSGNAGKALEVYNDLSAEFGYNNALMLEAAEIFLKGDPQPDAAFFTNELKLLANSLNRSSIAYLQALLSIRSGNRSDAVLRALLGVITDNAEPALAEKAQGLLVKYFADREAVLRQGRQQHAGVYALLFRLLQRRNDAAGVRGLFREYVEAGFVQSPPREIIEVLEADEIRLWPGFEQPAEITARLFSLFMQQKRPDLATAVINNSSLQIEKYYYSDYDLDEYAGRLNELKMTPAALENFLRQYFAFLESQNDADAARELVRVMKKRKLKNLADYEKRLTRFQARPAKTFISEDLANTGGES